MLDVFETMENCRAMRRLKPDPVPDNLIARILHARTCAPSGGNAQKWRFLVLKDRKTKDAVTAWYKKADDEIIGTRYSTVAPPPGVSPEKFKRQHSAVEYLTDHFAEAPVWIVACLEDGANPGPSSGASIYPAVQNMVLACRAVGLGTTLTNRHMFYQKEVDQALGLPEGVHSYAILPIGYPMGKFGPTGRGKMSEFVFGDKYGETWAPLAGK